MNLPLLKEVLTDPFDIENILIDRMASVGS